MTKTKRLRRNKRQGMRKRRISHKKPMNAEQKAARRKLQEITRAANEAAHPKKA